MDQPQYTSLVDALAAVPDPRKARSKRYPYERPSTGSFQGRTSPA